MPKKSKPKDRGGKQLTLEASFFAPKRESVAPESQERVVKSKKRGAERPITLTIDDSASSDDNIPLSHKLPQSASNAHAPDGGGCNRVGGGCVGGVKRLKQDRLHESSYYRAKVEGTGNGEAGKGPPLPLLEEQTRHREADLALMTKFKVIRHTFHTYLHVRCSRFFTIELAFSASLPSTHVYILTISDFQIGLDAGGSRGKFSRKGGEKGQHG